MTTTHPITTLAPDERWVWVPFDVSKEFDGFRADRFLAGRLAAHSRTKVQHWLREARVKRGDRWLRANSKVRAGDRIEIAYPRRPEKPLPPDAALPVLFEDDDFLIVDKPAGLLSHPTDKIVTHTVLGVLRKNRTGQAFHLLHRLDRETSGVLALAKNPRAARLWSQSMEARDVHKEYLALVRGVPSPPSGSMDWPIGRQGGDIKVRQWINAPGAVAAATTYRIEAVLANDCSLVRAFPRTGRLHQIRVHFAALGHPLLGDPLYQGDGRVYRKMIAGTVTEEDRATLGFPRAALHAAALEFPHPVTGGVQRVAASLPADFRTRLAASPGAAPDLLD
ncbi:MAG TPA: RluA family pseudouridine synthase [Elusimicrobiota bacterium]|nr:RluA family pseudouridine synthase [Elusimicrobiota bacterium]